MNGSPKDHASLSHKRPTETSGQRATPQKVQVQEQGEQGSYSYSIAV